MSIGVDEWGDCGETRLLLSSNRLARFSFSRWLSLSAAEGYVDCSWRARLSNLSSNLDVAADISSLVALMCQIMVSID